jgi:hypothetical protein
MRLRDQSVMNPINLILDGSHCLVLVEQTHLVGFSLLNHQTRFLDVIDRILSQNALISHNVKLQVPVFGQDQQLQSFIEVLLHIPDRT